MHFSSAFPSPETKEKQQKEEREENLHTVSIFSLTHAQVEIRVVLRSVTGKYQTMGENGCEIKEQKRVLNKAETWQMGC